MKQQHIDVLQIARMIYLINSDKNIFKFFKNIQRQQLAMRIGDAKLNISNVGQDSLNLVFTSGEVNFSIECKKFLDHNELTFLLVNEFKRHHYNTYLLGLEQLKKSLLTGTVNKISFGTKLLNCVIGKYQQFKFDSGDKRFNNFISIIPYWNESPGIINNYHAKITFNDEVKMMGRSYRKVIKTFKEGTDFTQCMQKHFLYVVIGNYII